MKKFLVILFAVALMLGLSAHAAAAQAASGTVTGKAVRWDGTPIAGATVRALAGWLETDKEISRTTSGADGVYTLSVPVGQPVWIHIDTFGTWWGYSYKPTFTLRPGEVISQVFFALGPRDVHEIVLPTPVSNIAPALGTNLAPVLPAAPQVQNKPVSNVKPLLGGNNVAKALPKPAPRQLPNTGGSTNAGLWAMFAAALALAVAGLAIRRQSVQSR